MEQHCFFFDIDNTLATWPDGVISDSTMDTLERLRRKGHFVALATGRLQVDALRFAKRAETPDFIADGGLSITRGWEIKSMEGLDHKACIDYIAQLELKHIEWAVTYDNTLRRFTPYEGVLDWAPSWDVFKTIHDKKIDYREFPDFYKLYVFITPEEEKRKDFQFLTDQYIRYGDNCILYEPMDKARGVRHMLTVYGMPTERAVVFGDGYNDLSMFSSDWMNIAMGNAREALKKEADYVTADCDKDGIYLACRHFGWI